ncbi:MAG: hypothetical protein IPG63_19755 [Xanthomonadales bacterium]|nr:hypothetical protein [Xanthomonadales bacterium]
MRPPPGNAQTPCTSSVCACGVNPSESACATSIDATLESQNSVATPQRSQMKNGTECCSAG